MAHATLDVRLAGIPEVVALLRAAADVVDLSTDGISHDPTWTHTVLVARSEYDALRSAVRVFIPEPDDATVGGSE